MTPASDRLSQHRALTVPVPRYSPETAAMTTNQSDLLRTIDISGWFSGDADRRSAIVEAVDAECRRIGFLRLSGHIISAELTNRMMAVTSAFFDLPEDVKRTYVVGDKAKNRGYSSYGAEALAYSLGVDSHPDMFEAFNCGVEVHDEGHPYYATERHRLFADNVWPTVPADMRSTWLEYFVACEALGQELMQIFATALGMPSHFLVGHTSKAPNVMRANNYQRRGEHADPADGQMRMGAHTDYGTCTILLADPVSGLEIVGPDGAWHPVMPEPGTLLVNLGDLLAEWTNDRWRSTVHRVVPPTGNGPSRRRSIAFFHEADYDALVTVMPTCVSDACPARYAPVMAGEHLMQKLMGPRTLQKSTADLTGLGDRAVAVSSAPSPEQPFSGATDWHARHP